MLATPSSLRFSLLQKKTTAQSMALFTSLRKPKTFQDSPSHQILKHTHEALDIDKNKN